MEYEKSKTKKLYCVVDNTEYIFIPILNPKKDDLLILNIDENFIFDDLPDNVYGKYLYNYEGYNPSGWWKYIDVKKNELIYR